MVHVGPLDVQVGDVVHVDGTLRTVRDLRVIDGGTGRLLIFDDGASHRLRAGETLPFQDRRTR